MLRELSGICDKRMPIMLNSGVYNIEDRHRTSALRRDAEDCLKLIVLSNRVRYSLL